jgi:hypothetical protein
VPIATCGTAFDDATSGITYLLVFHEYLYYGTRSDHSLHNPNQLRAYGHEVSDNPFDKIKGLQIVVEGELAIPMSTKGTKVFFVSRCPTEDKIRNSPRVVMTSATPWNPDKIILGETMTPFYQDTDGDYIHKHPDNDESILHSINLCLVELREKMVSQIRVLPVRKIGEILTAETSADLPICRTFISTECYSKETADSLAEKFLISPERAKATMNVTTQRGTRSAIMPLARRYRADRYLEVKRLRGKFATDTLFRPCRSLNGNIATQVYTHKMGFNATYHLKRVYGEEVGTSLQDMIHEYGAPEHLTFDGAAVQVRANTKFMKTIKRADIRYHVSQRDRPNDNPAEAGIREAKRRWYRIKEKKIIPDRLWDFGISWVCETGNVTDNGSRFAKGRTPLEIISRVTPDITEHLDFGFYDWVKFRNNAGLG